MPPAGLYYLTSHEWVRLDGNRGRVGITDFAVAEIKDIVYVDLPQPGTLVTAGAAFGAVETVKAAFDLYAPVSGTVAAANPDLAAHPERVAEDPFGAGWMIEIEAPDAAGAAKEAGALLDAAGYEAHCRSHAGH